MSKQYKMLFFAVALGLIGLSLQPAAQARDIGTGATSFGPATRGFAHSFRPNPHTGAKYFDGRFLKAEGLRSDVKSKAKHTNGYIKLQVKRGSSLTTTAPAKGISMYHNFVMLKKD